VSVLLVADDESVVVDVVEVVVDEEVVVDVVDELVDVVLWVLDVVVE